MEPKQIAALVGGEPSVILEVGANDGGVGNAIADLLPYATVYAFEPDPRAINRFLERVSNPRVHLIQAAVGQGPARKTTFFQSDNMPNESLAEQMPNGWDYSGSIRKPTGHLTHFPWVTFERQIEVDLISLDAWSAASGIDRINFIWADVQGAEGDMISGGLKLLSRTQYLYTECFDFELYEGAANLEKILQLLPDFEVVERFTEDVLLKNKAVRA